MSRPALRGDAACQCLPLTPLLPPPRLPPDAVQLAFDRLARAQVERIDLARFVPLIAIALVVALSAGIAYLLINEDRALQRDALHRDTDTMAQSLSLRLQAISEATSTLARDAAVADRPERRFVVAARDTMTLRPEVVHIAVVDPTARVTRSVASPGPLGESVRLPNTQLTSERVRSGDQQRPRCELLVRLIDVRRSERLCRPGQRRTVHRHRRANRRQTTSIAAR